MSIRRSWPVTGLISLIAASQPYTAYAESGAPTKPLAALAATALPPDDLAKERARGLVIGSALADGEVTGNLVTGPAVTGIITNTNSINNNVGITTVFQNTGNNSLFQQSTSIFITIH